MSDASWKGKYVVKRRSLFISDPPLDASASERTKWLSTRKNAAVSQYYTASGGSGGSDSRAAGQYSRSDTGRALSTLKTENGKSFPMGEGDRSDAFSVPTRFALLRWS